MPCIKALQENFDDQVPSEQAAGSVADSQENKNPKTNGKDERRDE